MRVVLSAGRFFRKISLPFLVACASSAFLLATPASAHAAISFVGSAINSSSPNTATTVTLPGGMSVNDLIIVAAAVGDTANNGMAAPTTGGYTRIGTATIYSNKTNDVNLDIYYKFHNGSDTTVAFGAVGGTNASNVAVVMVFRGVNTSSPFDTSVSTASGISSSNANPPSHDWSGTSGVWTVAIGATGHTGGATATFTAPTGYTTNFAFRAHNDTIDALVGMGYNSSPSDPEDPGAFTAATIGTAASNAWAAATISLTPAIAPSVTTGVAGPVGASDAIVNGAISSIGSDNASVRGFAYSTDSGLTTGVSTTTDAGSWDTGSFSASLSSLSNDTIYYYRAYATNTGGTGFGTIRSFTTGNTTVTRRMRLFEGFRLRILDGRMILYQK